MDNQRLILFIVFSFSLLLLWEAWQGKHAPAPVAPTTSSAPAAIGGAPVPSQALNAPLPGQAPAAAPAQTAFATGQRAVIETDTLRAVIDANGGDLRQLDLLNYREIEDKKQTLSLFEDDPTQPYLAQSG